MKWGRRLCTFVRTREIVPSHRLCHGIAARLSTSVLSEKEASLKLHGSNILSSNEHIGEVCFRAGGWCAADSVRISPVGGPRVCLKNASARNETVRRILFIIHCCRRLAGSGGQFRSGPPGNTGTPAERTFSLRG